MSPHADSTEKDIFSAKIIILKRFKWLFDSVDP